MRKMDKVYKPELFESRIYKEWEESSCFNPDSHGSKESKAFLITMPPPNVTGSLHQGHAIFVSIQDACIRWKRMQGRKALWLPGTDHAGIATQLMVERKLESQGKSRQKIGKEAFLKETWDWTREHGGKIQKQFRSLGASCDWTREQFTMDKKSNETVKASFIQFYQDGLIYRGERIVNWSTKLLTAVSDLEVVSKTVQGFLYHIRYLVDDDSGSHLVVATTRPETLFADVAVAINPEDERYKKFHGKKLRLPLTDRVIPIILDKYVDKDFGTGALKITPGHDPNDWKLAQSHNLPTLSVMDRSGKLSELAGDLKGLYVKEGRKKTVEKLKEEKLLVKKENYTHEVGHCQRSGVPIEPMVSMQWWLKTKPLADKALAAIKKDKSNRSPLQFFPSFWEKTYKEWLSNLEDWCISRQLWWGHQIPAWHCKDCSAITVAKSLEAGDPVNCSSCDSKNIYQEEDVLDTWYSSGLWPITTLGWPKATKDLEYYYPNTKYNGKYNPDIKALMETGSDIIFFWVSRMMMMCTHLMEGRIPFEHVYLHPMLRDEKGQKMSKTKNNTIDPIDIVKEHGADALRLTLLVLSGVGRSINFSIKRLEGYKAFLNKLWNASRFLLPHLEEKNQAIFDKEWSKEELSKCDSSDLWIIHQLNNCIQEVNKQLSNYRFDLAYQAIYEFTWHDFCDWYLELSKLRDLKKESSGQKTLYYCLKNILALLHPFAPFITEEVYSYLQSDKKKKLITSSYPELKEITAAPLEALKEINTIKKIVDSLRNFRTENKIKPKTEIKVYLETAEEELWKKVEIRIAAISKVSLPIEKITASKEDYVGELQAGAFHLVIPLEGLVDKEAEKTRLETEIRRTKKSIEGSNKKLLNENFIKRANPELVKKEQEIAKELKEKLSLLEKTMNQLG